MNLSPLPLHFFILSPFSCSQASRLLQFLQPWLNISFHTFNSHVEIRVCYIKRESVTGCLPVSVGTLFAAWCIIGGGRANKIVVWRVQPHEDWGRTLLQSSYCRPNRCQTLSTCTKSDQPKLFYQIFFHFLFLIAFPQLGQASNVGHREPEDLKIDLHLKWHILIVRANLNNNKM